MEVRYHISERKKKKERKIIEMEIHVEHKKTNLKFNK